jgi:hypothetical protein
MWLLESGHDLQTIGLPQSEALPCAVTMVNKAAFFRQALPVKVGRILRPRLASLPAPSHSKRARYPLQFVPGTNCTRREIMERPMICSAGSR